MIAIFADRYPNERKSASLASDEGCMPVILEACKAEVLPNQPAAVAAAVGEGDANDAQSESSPAQVSLTEWASGLVKSEMENGMAENLKGFWWPRQMQQWL